MTSFNDDYFDAAADPWPDDEHGSTGTAVPVSSWQPVDLGPWLDGEPPNDEPTILDFGPHRLLYPHAVNAIQGEPESAKSWVALHACAEQVDAGHPVVYIDFESSPKVVTVRLVALGVDPDTIRSRFHYIAPGARLAADDRLADTLEGIGPALVVIDGVTNSMAMFGLSITSNDDVAKWLQILPQPIADLGPAVLLVDHVTKSKDDRGRYAIGAQHKLAMLGGAAYNLDVLEPFGRGRTGKVKVTCTKDRLGHVRGACSDGKTVGTITLTSDPGTGTVTLDCEPWQPAGQWQPTELMAKLSLHLETSGELTAREVREAFPGRAEWRTKALAGLVAGGYVTVRHEGQKKLHRHVKPFPDPPTVYPFPTRSQPVPGTGTEPVPRSPCVGGNGNGSGTGGQEHQTRSQQEPLLNDDHRGRRPGPKRLHDGRCADCQKATLVDADTGRCLPCAAAANAEDGPDVEYF